MARTKKTEITETAPPQAVAPAPKMGRPTSYNQSIASLICDRIAEGESLREIIKTEGMPDRVTVYRWLMVNEDFRNHYTRAREEQADTYADEIIAIADEQPEIIAVTDKKTGALIEHKLDGAFLQWQKNRIDARKWTAMKLKPKKYGDRMQMGGDAENPFEVKVDLGIFETILKAVELKRQTESNV
jgi:hypothetical protein